MTRRRSTCAGISTAVLMSGTLMLGCNDGDNGFGSVIGNAICDTDVDGGLLPDGGASGPLTGGLDGGLLDASVGSADGAVVTPTPPVAPTTPVTPQDVFIPLTEGQVVGVALALHAGEVDGAKAALTRIVDPDVHAFAEEMLASHEAAQGQLLAVGIAPQPSDKATELQTAAATAKDLLTNLTDGAAFDNAYIRSQLNAHQRVRTLFDVVLRRNAVTMLLQTELKAERDEAVKHLSHAQALIDGAPRVPAPPPVTPVPNSGNTSGGGITTGGTPVAGSTGPALGGTGSNGISTGGLP